jgi:acyl carrier protein
MLDLPEFAEALSTALEISFPDDATSESGMFSDIGLDSLQAFEMIIFIEAKANLMVPPDDLPMIFTLGDAYEYYLMAIDLAAAER